MCGGTQFNGIFQISCDTYELELPWIFRLKNFYQFKDELRIFSRTAFEGFDI